MGTPSRHLGGDDMKKPFLPKTRWGSGPLKDRLYWAAVGVLAASIVWLPLGSTLWSGDSEPTTAVEVVPSQAVDTAGSPEPTQATDEMDHSGESSQAGVTPSEDPASSGTGEVDTDTIGIRLSVCQEVYDTQQQPLRDADSAMGQWEVHVGAMNKLVVGAITLTQATQFWNQTRVGAMGRLQAFATSDGEYQQRTSRCPLPVRQQQSDNRLHACQHGVAARHRVLRLGRDALDTWRHHVMHMEMLRDGKMTPARATELWLRSWRDGQRQIDSYRSALGAARGARC
jgi:hypothetical protein